jgi:hypothetical protein
MGSTFIVAQEQPHYMLFTTQYEHTVLGRVLQIEEIFNIQLSCFLACMKCFHQNAVVQCHVV